jgi:hypothetical protein
MSGDKPSFRTGETLTLEWSKEKRSSILVELLFHTFVFALPLAVIFEAGYVRLTKNNDITGIQDTFSDSR